MNGGSDALAATSTVSRSDLLGEIIRTQNPPLGTGGEEVGLQPLPFGLFTGPQSLPALLVECRNLRASVSLFTGRRCTCPFETRRSRLGAGLLLEFSEERGNTTGICRCDSIVQQHLSRTASQSVNTHEPLVPARIPIDLTKIRDLAARPPASRLRRASLASCRCKLSVLLSDFLQLGRDRMQRGALAHIQQVSAIICFVFGRQLRWSFNPPALGIIARVGVVRPHRSRQRSTSFGMGYLPLVGGAV